MMVFDFLPSPLIFVKQDIIYKRISRAEDLNMVTKYVRGTLYKLTIADLLSDTNQARSFEKEGPAQHGGDLA